MKLAFCFGAVALVATVACVDFQHSSSLNESENRKIKDIFTREFEDAVRIYPQFATYVGRKEGYDRLNDVSEESNTQDFARTRDYLSELNKIRYTFLGEEEKVSYEFFKYLCEMELEGEKFRYHNYPINQMSGLHTDLITFMTNRHLVESTKDAQDYISRLNQFGRYFNQVIARLKIRKEKGIIAPRFTLVKSNEDIKNLLVGAPFDKSGNDSVLWSDFKKKLAKLNLDAAENSKLLAEAEKALLVSVGPGLKDLSAYLEKLRRIAPAEGGAWNLPRGFAYYDYSLRQYTTTNLTANEIHQIGLNEVARLQKEILTVITPMGAPTGSWREINKWMGNYPKFYYSNDEAGRKNYLAESQRVMTNMQNHLHEAFGILPRAVLEVRAVEPYREKSAGLAFYENPSTDGKVPGIYYVNLGNMAQANRYELEALAYHEGIPGHHLQGAIALERKELPDFRKYRWLSAFGEGWALYAEFLAKEMGMYKDPVADFGRLTMELWRAARLVVDTGLHAKKWSYKKAKEYLLSNTPEVEAEIEMSVQRYTIWPGQATAYKIGMLKILELRQMAKSELGPKFNIRNFHDELMRQGTMPLGLMEKQIQIWILNQKKL